ncbi:Zinc finger CCCH domain protein [Quillaja saponaria]|uniref:Zinc finger CCCH domain protein n=1 Tax=Quillaja saponaria TaxID=32244 RepID=A0AAD7PLM2_QUISA|nr:Zinc finger CCCH domain protein [Quillaja saponaria]
MPENRQIQKNAVSDQNGDNIEEGLFCLKVNNNQDGDDDAQSSPYPDRPSEPDCLYYLRTGLCRYGSNCRYNHPAYASHGAQNNGELPERVGKPDCGYFMKTGTCKYGPTCKYHHPRDRRGASSVSFNVLGLPMRQEEKSCPFYMRTGSCKFGVACKFHHPQPASLGTILPAAGSSASTITPVSGLPFIGGLPAWSLPRMSYLSAPYLQGPQPYTPFLLSPQGIVPGQSWNTYMGSMTSPSSTSMDGSNLVYSSMNLGELGSGGPVNLLSTSSLSLPERPDQPECRYFLSTGTCKYGSDCKFHHPKERVAPSALSPIGLPSRPGQAICSYYRIYGLCKYGPTCKFDHPFVAHPYNYSLNPTAVTMLDSSLINYPRGLSAVQVSETSSKSTRSRNLVHNRDPASNKNQNSDSEATEEPLKRDDSPQKSFPSSSESLHD